VLPGNEMQPLRRDVRQDPGHTAVDEPGGQGTTQILRRLSHDRDLTRFKDIPHDHLDIEPMTSAVSIRVFG
jgi:hypothetical protein